MNFVTITTINEPNAGLEDFVALGYDVIVAGDSKTPNDAWLHLPKGVHYLDLHMQRDLAPDLDELVGKNTYARKNFAYLYAIAHGASTIWETDDDTFIRADVLDPLSYITNGRRLVANGGIWNPYSHFAPESDLWPRGIPLRAIAKETATNATVSSSTRTQAIRLLQLLVNGDPDVDAIYRLTHQDNQFSYEPVKDTVDLGSARAPGNTQATIWTHEEDFSYLYLPSSVSFRFSDILKMYIAQTFVPMTYGGFLMNQVRNPHNLLEDFESEIEMYLLTEKLILTLSESKSESVTQVYKELALAGITSSRESETVEAYVKAMGSFK